MSARRILKSLTFASLCLISCLSAKADDPQGKQYLEIPFPDEWRAFCHDRQTNEVSDPRWWQRFDDAILDSLMEIALSNNYDIRMAAKRIEIAQASVGSARAGYYPTVGVAGSYTRGRSSGLSASRHGDAADYGYFNAGVTMNWEIDLFGRINSQVKAAKGNLMLSRAERSAVKVSLEAQIASAYVQLRVQQAQLQVANEHSQRQLKSLEIAKARFEADLSSMMDVNQASQVYYSTIAQIPLLENSIHNSITVISVLLGQAPESLMSVLEPSRPMPGYVQIVAAGTPLDLLRRRPDVVEAEEQIGICATKLGIAKKDWLPTLSLAASAGTQAHDARDLFKSNSLTYSVVPTLSWTIFDGFARKYNIASARLDMENAIENYNFTVLTAVREANNALSTYFSDLKYIDKQIEVVNAGAGYADRAFENYKSGLSPYINVADAQMTYLENMNTLISAKGQALNALIDLYKALGGGWSDSELR